MKKVGFLLPNNDLIYMNYGEVEDFCKKICFDEKNLDAFLNFKVNYSYFSPYFDFVMIHKKYLFLNSLFNKETFIIYRNKAYYYNFLVSDNYFDNVVSFEKNFFRGMLSDLTTVSDFELDIKKQNVKFTDDCLIDPNGVGMMSKTNVGGDYGSHSVTASTVLNQLLIKSDSLAKFYYNLLDHEVLFDDTFPIIFMIQCLGFLRVASRDSYPIIMANKNLLSERCNEFVQLAEKNGYVFLNDSCDEVADEDLSLIVKEYEKCVYKLTK